MVNESIVERYSLIVERIKGIVDEESVKEPFLSFFRKEAEFIRLLDEVRNLTDNGKLRSLELGDLKELNKKLYEDILADNYDKCFGNPVYLTNLFSEYSFAREYKDVLLLLYAEIRGLIPYAFENDLEVLTSFFEFFVEVYNLFTYAQYDFMETYKEDEDKNEGITKAIGLPSTEELMDSVYSFENDVCELLVKERVESQVDPKCDYATRIIMDSDLDDMRYLYYFGEYISDDEIKIAEFLNQLSQDEIKKMASTYTEGYRIGFIKGGKDLSIKNTVNIRYNIGFERMVRAAIGQFEKMGLQPVIYRASTLSVNKKNQHIIGYTSSRANKQYDFDHRQDQGLYFDKEFMNRKLNCLKVSFEENKEKARKHAGPAVIEVFGEEPFAPQVSDACIRFNNAQEKLSVDYDSKAFVITNEYIPSKERSFTIIAYPTPVIGDNFEGIFRETVLVNTLDYVRYEKLQQIIIDTLDKASKVHILGAGENETDLYVSLHELHDPNKETLFENCVADVNIPVGEVFTSPKLNGTTGLLHVKETYLEGLKYNDLKIKFTDGVITDYSCDNFESLEEGRKYIKDNVLFNHETLPMGEFAIGTNTTAYAMSRKYNIGDKLPILIGEKTGPHFAVGDTCYSHEEDIKTYNPDGKEIIARENEISALRNTDMSKAYFNCHTDITIPYDELGAIYAIDSKGNETAIILNGRFVLPELDELNVPLDKMCNTNA